MDYHFYRVVKPELIFELAYKKTHKRSGRKLIEISFTALEPTE
jgi:hypothetical protein